MADEFIMPKHIVLGEDALEKSKGYLKEFGKKALIVTSNGMVRLGNTSMLTEILSSINIEYSIYSEINSEPTDKMIANGTDIFKDEKCDFLIGLGGGSPIDSAKAIGIMVTNPGEISDYMKNKVSNNPPTIVAIPTTAGTGSEATKFTIINDTKNNVKMLIKADSLIPSLTIIDSKFTITCPSKITTSTGLDALTHAIEAYTSKKAQSLSDIFALSAIKRIFKFLPMAFKDGENIEARNQMSIAALEAGIAFNNSSVTIVHGMSRPIGALYHIPHGLSNAILLSQCLKFVVDGCYDRFSNLAKVINLVNGNESDKEAANKFIEEIEKLCKSLKVPTLTDLGIDEEVFFNNIDKMAIDAMESGSPQNTIKNVTEKNVIDIYIKVFGSNNLRKIRRV